MLWKRFAPIVCLLATIMTYLPASSYSQTPDLEAARETARRTNSAANLKQITMAAFMYESEHNEFPPRAIFNKEGKPMLSWRVQLLPYFNEEDLYKQFHQDEPWDSEHNKRLIPRMPKIFQNPSGTTKPGMTNYLAVCGTGLAFDGTKGLQPKDVKEPSKTIMVIEVDDDCAVVWTKPGDWQYDAKDPLAGLGVAHPNGFNAGFVDGHIGFITKDIDPKVFQSMLTIGGTETVRAEDVQAGQKAKIQPQVEQQAATQLYVKTVPPGATVIVDGKKVGKSNGLFDVTPGAHKVALQIEGYKPEERSIEATEDEITRIKVSLSKQSGMTLTGDRITISTGDVGQQTVLSYVGDSSSDMRSFADSGHAVAFQRPANRKSISAVKLFAARYGMPQPPNEDFHLYLLDQNQKVLEQIAIPYSKIKRMEKEGELRWYTLEFPAVEVPENFFVAVWFNAERTKGVYLGMQKDVKETHSYVGLPDKGFKKVEQSYEWMIRVVVSSEEGKKPSCPKVTTYEEEKAADTESTEAAPVEESEKPAASKPGELSQDNGTMAGKLSINGGGHAVKFKVDGDSWKVTSVSLHGSRYGEVRPPKEDFKVWICDAQFKPIATFHFPYSSYTRSDPVWKTFRIRPTRVPKDFIVCFGFNPEQTKGVYVSYDSKASETSMIGVPGEGEPKPFTKGNWMIRCKIGK